MEKWKLNRRRLVGVLLVVAVLAVAVMKFANAMLPSGILPQESLLELADAKYIRQIVSQNNENGRTIMWQTDSQLTEPGVEYRVAGSWASEKVEAVAEHYTDDGQDVMLYTAQLSNLPAGEKMEYRLLGNGSSGAWHELETDNGGSFKALIFPDSQSGDYSGWKKLAQDAASRNPDVKFFVNMGDLVDNGEASEQWRDWFDSVYGIIDRIPLVPLMGNHETYDRNWQVRQPVAYLREFDVPDNGHERYDRYYYSFDYGPVHFIVLNTSQWELRDLAPDMASEQTVWFRQDVASTDKKWKVVLMHRDSLQYRINGRDDRPEGFDDEGVRWMPLFDEAGIDVVLSAHLHTYRNRGHILNFDRNPAGPLYILTGVAGDVRYDNLWVDHALDEFVAPQPDPGNYLTLDASEDKLELNCYFTDGTLMDHAEVSK